MTGATLERQERREQRQDAASQSEEAILTAIVLAFAAYQSAQALSGYLRTLPLGLSQAAIDTATTLVFPSATIRLDTGSAGAWFNRTSLPFRARYLLNAARRINQDLIDGRSLREALERERVNLDRHRQAERARREAAELCDRMAEVYGPVLGRKAVMDDTTDDVCADANRKNFRVNPPPKIGFPGALHGGYCRCLPTKPYPNAEVIA